MNSGNWTGRWERLSLRQAGTASDTTSRVIWLQTSRLYCDLRVPADRPSFHGHDSLSAMTDAQLQWLAGQQGFAGHLEATADLCHWHRHIDFQPPAPLPDAGRMHPPDTGVDGRVTETGLFLDYTEEWRRTDSGCRDRYAAKLLVEGGPGESPLRQGFLLALGDSFMFALERAVPPARRAALLHRAFDRHERAALIEALDFEISCGTRRGGGVPWAVTLSTLPFLEGRPLLATDRGVPRIAAGLPDIDRPSLADRRLHWIVYERGEDFAGF